jgi:hypothetical protein
VRGPRATSTPPPLRVAASSDRSTRALAGAIDHAVRALTSAEDELAQMVGVVARAAETVIAGPRPEPGQPVATINPLGEPRGNGPSFDLLIAVRAVRIDHLRVLVGPWPRGRPAGGSTH